MDGLIVGTRGSEEVSFNDLRQFQPPPPTKTYYPVSHYDLSKQIKTFSQDILSDYTLSGEGFVIARKGQQLFAKLDFIAEDSKIGISVAWRNSTDKSMSIGFVCGNNVFCCSNMMMTGDITVMKKHTPGAENTLTDLLITTLHKSRYTYSGLIRDAEQMRSINWTDTQAGQMAGQLFFNGILSPRQLPVVKKQWETPGHDDFKARNLFSFYNACTESLKSAPPNKIMESHIQLHSTISGTWEV